MAGWERSDCRPRRRFHHSALQPIDKRRCVCNSPYIDCSESIPGADPMSRVQLALNVPDIDKAVAFYSKLFGVEPAKRQPGYANFAITDPPLKLVLFENASAEARLNHLGVEVMSSDEVAAHQARLSDAGLAPVDESGTC